MTQKENERLVPAVNRVRDSLRVLRDARLTMAGAINAVVEQDGDVSVMTKDWYRKDSSDASILENAPIVRYVEPDTGVYENGVALGAAAGDEGVMITVRRIDGNILDDVATAVPVEYITNTEELYDLF